MLCQLESKVGGRKEGSDNQNYVQCHGLQKKSSINVDDTYGHAGMETDL